MSDTNINHTAGVTFELPQNYSILINKLEQLALGLDTALGNFTLDRKEVAISLAGATDAGISSEEILFGVGSPIAAGRAPPPRVITHSLSADTDEYARVVSDIWIGVILTLLIVSVIFFICACFLYHKFQQWKNSYRTSNANEPLEICRRFPPDYEVESLPSYTIVSGLPTYDDALEEFRKAGIILTPTAVVPIIKIFDADIKDASPQIYNSAAAAAAHCETTFSIANEQQQSSHRASNDNISLSSTCTCGAGSLNQQPTQLSNGLTLNAATLQPQFIELSPEHLAALSQKRLSLQITFNGSLRRNSRARVDLRNTLLRSRAGNAVAAASAANERATLDAGALLPPIHRSSSVNSLQHERNLLDQRLQHLHHRGSLC